MHYGVSLAIFLDFAVVSGRDECMSHSGTKKYRSSMFYVGIFQLFFTFVSYRHKLVAKKSGFLLNWSKIVQQYDRSDVVTQ